MAKLLEKGPLWQRLGRVVEKEMGEILGKLSKGLRIDQLGV